MSPHQTSSPGPETLDALAAVVGLLDGARLSADVAAQGDLLSPWANVAMSAHLAAAPLQKLLTWPSETRIVGDCRGNLARAAEELDRLDPSSGLDVDGLVLARCWLATALADADRLQSP